MSRSQLVTGELSYQFNQKLPDNAHKQRSGKCDASTLGEWNQCSLYPIFWQAWAGLAFQMPNNTTAITMGDSGHNGRQVMSGHSNEGSAVNSIMPPMEKGSQTMNAACNQC